MRPYLHRDVIVLCSKFTYRKKIDIEKHLILTFFPNLNVLVLKQVCIFLGQKKTGISQIVAATLLLKLILSP